MVCKSLQVPVPDLADGRGIHDPGKLLTALVECVEPKQFRTDLGRESPSSATLVDSKSSCTLSTNSASRHTSPRRFTMGGNWSANWRGRTEAGSVVSQNSADCDSNLSDCSCLGKAIDAAEATSGNSIATLAATGTGQGAERFERKL